MLLQTTPEFRRFFLLEFTKELIRASRKFTIIPEEKQEINIPKKQFYIPSRFNIPRMPITQAQTPQIIYPKKMISPKAKPLVSRTEIFNPSLPPRLQYLKPIPTNVELNLNKLNALIRDPAVLSLECDGPGKNISVNFPSPKTTGIILTSEEIDGIIKEFSDKARIPIEKGIFKVAVGRLILLAAISEIVDTKFIIKKIMAPLEYPQQQIF